MDANLVADRDVLACRRCLPGGWLDSRSGYRLLFSYYLGRQLTLEEADDILSRINGLGPQRYEDSWESMVRNTTSFWRS